MKIGENLKQLEQINNYEMIESRSHDAHAVLRKIEQVAKGLLSISNRVNLDSGASRIKIIEQFNQCVELQTIKEKSG